MECKNPFHVPILLLHIILVVVLFSSDVNGSNRFLRPGGPPPPVVKVGKDVVSLTMKRGSSRNGPAQTVDIAPLLSSESNSRRIGTTSLKKLRNPSLEKSPNPGLMILRRKTTNPHVLGMYAGQPTTKPPSRFSNFLKQTLGLGGITVSIQPQQQRNNIPAQASHQKLAGSIAGKSQYHRTILPILQDYKRQKEAADKYYAKYLKTLQLLAIATNPDKNVGSENTQDPIPSLTLSFKDSPYSLLLENATFVPTKAVEIPLDRNVTSKTFTDGGDQEPQASERSDTFHPNQDIINVAFNAELEKQKRKILSVFPPPHSEVPFGERTILMVRFPPVPAPPPKKHKEIKLKTEYNIDGGITFGGPRWMSFGQPFDPFDHPWYHIRKGPPKVVLAEADKPSGYGVIITQNFIHRPSIRFSDAELNSLKYNGDLLDGGPSIVAQLAKALAEGNRISNAYFLSKNLQQGKTWAGQETKPPFVIVHLDTYTKNYNETDALGLGDQVEANYSNGTIIYPTKNDPNILASTKFEFHDPKEIEHVFDKPLSLLGHGWGWRPEPVFPKGINEIKNFLRLMYKVHHEAHIGAKYKSKDLKKAGDQLTKPAFPDSKPLLRDQIADRSTNWLHTSSVGIRSLSEDDDHFPYEHEPVVDVTHEHIHYHYL